MASCKGHVSVVELLLVAPGIDVNRASRNGEGNIFACAFSPLAPEREVQCLCATEGWGTAVAAEGPLGLSLLLDGKRLGVDLGAIFEECGGLEDVLVAGFDGHDVDCARDAVARC